MRAVSREEMIDIDRRSIADHGVPGMELMDAAGKAVAETISSLDIDKTQTIGIVCGTGNNGGDGFVAARYLHEKNHPVHVYLLGRTESLKGDAKNAFEQCPVKTLAVNDLSQCAGLAKIDIMVDCIFGTGLTKRPGELGLAFKVIKLINTFDTYHVAVDIPSGLDANTGLPIYDKEYTFRAKKTVTMGLPKVGMIGDPGATFCGEVITAKLPFPNELIDIVNPPNLFVDPQDFSTHMQKRASSSQKGDFGHIVVVGGSPEMPGALMMATHAALMGGAGKVTSTLPDPKFLSDFSAKLPEAMWIDKTNLSSLLQKNMVLVIGPGLGKSQETLEILRLAQEKKEQMTVVLDADALNVWAEHPDEFDFSGNRVVITPHPGELARLLKTRAKDIQANRMAAVQQAVKQFDVWVVLKGFRTLIASPDGHSIDINPTGNPGMAKGGSGDVLAGLMGARLGHVENAEDMRAAIDASVYLHGLAGDLALQEKGEESMLASDIIEQIPKAIQQCQP